MAVQGSMILRNKLVQLFPDCSIIVTHRNPLECVTSYASMMAAMMLERDFDKKELGPITMEYLACKVERSLKARNNFSADRILDLQFNDFVDNPLETVNKIYRHFHIDMSNATKSAMEAYAHEHPMGKHGKHEYHLEEYGLTEKQVLDRFDFYIKRFNSPMD
jgi:hypothetical protein